MSRALTYTAVALLALGAAVALAPTSTAAPGCYGAVVNGQFTGVCIIHNCATSPSGTGLVVYVSGNPGRCIGLV